VKTIIWLFVAVAAVLWVAAPIAAETSVIINLSEQRAYLIEQGKITLISPIASGKPGWETPTGNFTIVNKDIDHRSRGFGSVVDASGRSSTLMQPLAAEFPGVGISDPRRCRTTWNSGRRLVCTAGTFQDIPHPTAACECLKILPPSFSNEFTLELQS